MKLLCGQCGNMVEIDESQSGDTVLCSQCRHPIPVPLVHADRIDRMGPEQLAKHLNSEDFLNNPFVDQPPEDFVDKAHRVMARKMDICCDACRARMSVGIRFVGQTIRCIACGKEVRVPYNRKLDELESEVVEKITELELMIAKMSDEEYAAFQAGVIPPSPEEFPRPSNRRNMLVVWIVIAVTLLLVGAAAYYFAFGGGSSGTGQ